MGVIAVAALLGLGALHLQKKQDLAPAAAYLCMLMAGLLLAFCAALTNVLRYAVCGMLLWCVGVTLWDVRQEGPRAFLKRASAFIGSAAGLAMAAGLVLWTVFLVRPPMFTYWDEFMIWGVNAKVVQYTGALYTANPTVGILTDPCGTALLSYLFQFFNRAFSESDLYLSYALFTFITFAAAAELPKKQGRRGLTWLLFVLLALTPLLQGYHGISANYLYISYGYATAMADHLLAVGMLACVALYLAQPQKRWYWAALFITGQIKESGVLLALVAAAVIAVLRFGQKQRGRAALLRWAGAALLDMAVAAGGYVVWLVYLPQAQRLAATGVWAGVLAAALLGGAILLWRAVGAQRRARLAAMLRRHRVAVWSLAGAALCLALVGGILWVVRSGNLSVFKSRLNAVFQILASMVSPGSQNADRQQAISIIWTRFCTEHTFMPMADLLLVLVMTAVVALCCFNGKNKRTGWQLAAVQLVLALGGAAYLYVTAYFTAGYFATMGMLEYGRYFSSYLFGWLYIVLVLVGMFGRRLGRLTVMAATAFCLAATARLGLDHTILATPQNYAVETQAVAQISRRAAEGLQPDDRVLVLLRDSNDGTYLRCTYYLYPALVGRARVDASEDYSQPYHTDEAAAAAYGHIVYHQAAPDDFAAMLQRNFDYLLVAGDDGHYAAEYGALFDGGLQVGRLYRVTQNDTPLQPVTDDSELRQEGTANV